MGHAKERDRPGNTVATSEGRLVGCYDSESNTKRPFRQEASFEAFARINRAQLRFELIGFDFEEQRALYTEGQAWKRVCSALLYNGEAAQ